MRRSSQRRSGRCGVQACGVPVDAAFEPVAFKYAVLEFCGVRTAAFRSAVFKSAPFDLDLVSFVNQDILGKFKKMVKLFGVYLGTRCTELDKLIELPTCDRFLCETNLCKIFRATIFPTTSTFV